MRIVVISRTMPSEMLQGYCVMHIERFGKKTRNASMATKSAGFTSPLTDG